MSDFIYIAPCHFGLEAVLKREITDMGLRIEKVEDGRISFAGTEADCARANLFLRSAERILIRIGEFKAATFDELFDGTKSLPWESILPAGAKFWVAKVSSVNSALFSPSDIQSVMKKAMVDRMTAFTGIRWFKEDGPSYPLRVTIKKDIVTVALDTSGMSLHKRGYRVSPVIAPISETLAASLILLTPWHADRILIDPFCGSGTIPIEAAMMAKNIAPGAKRHFLAEEWTTLIPKDSFRDARSEAAAKVKRQAACDIQAYDLDPRAVRFARENAEAAGVADLIHFQARDVKDLRHPKKYGFVITNPPYGERLEDKEAMPELYTAIGQAMRQLDAWSLYLVTSYEDAERYIGRKADRNRKIYNGMLKTYYYQFLGPKPPRKPREKREMGKQ
jgi:putative N6-adenine-specific DNA methylase